MSQVFFISDLHLAHANVIKFSDGYRAKCLGIETIDEHDEKIYDLWNDTIHKRDLVFCLGDVGVVIDPIKKLPGTKKLLLGNHDHRHASEYLGVFDDIIGPIKYKKYWLAHQPTIQHELYGKSVIHGHTHANGINDSRYINVSIEMTNGYPINFQNIVSGKFITWNRVNYPLGVINNNFDKNPSKIHD